MSLTRSADGVHRSGDRSRDGLLLAVLAVTSFVTGCATSQVTDWALLAVDDRTIELMVEVGDGTCHSLGPVVLHETTTEVSVTAHRRWHEDRPCTLERNVEKVVVELDRPLGDRELTGCRASGSYAHVGSGFNCREVIAGE